MAEATVVICTKDRHEALALALRSLQSQDIALDVLVIDDGSVDGTPEMVATAFPDVRLLRSERPEGYVRQRNRGVREARAPFIVQLDDDVEVQDPQTVSATLRRFSDDRIAAVTIPHVNVRRGPNTLRAAPDPGGVWITDRFQGCSVALRRDVFLALGGYREDMVHLLEEHEFALRLLRDGHLVRLGHLGRPVLHHESTVRDPRRDVCFIVRNHAVIAFLHVPFPDVIERIVKIIGYAVWNATRWRVPMEVFGGLASGGGFVVHRSRERRPLSRALYRAFRRMRNSPARLADVEPFLTPVRTSCDLRA